MIRKSYNILEISQKDWIYYNRALGDRNNFEMPVIEIDP